MKQKLTKQLVDKLTCSKPAGRQFVRDTVCRGLCLEIRSTGGKTYYLSYRNSEGQQRLKKLANAEDISPAQARQLCEQARQAVVMGEQQAVETAAAITTDEFFYERYLPYAKTYKRSWDTDLSVYRTHVAPIIGSTPLAAVGYDEVAVLMTTAAPKLKHNTLYRLYVLVRYIFNCALRWEVAGVLQNPTNNYKIKQSKQHRERYLNRAETQRLMQAIQQSENTQLQYIVQMLLLTGARKREVLDARWQDIDVERRYWRIPFTKSGVERYVPLSDAVVSLLERVPRFDGCDWVFANPKTLEPFRVIFHSWDTARTRAGLRDVRIHDLRHSFASFLVNAGCSIYDVQKLLGHSTVTMTQRYSHLSQERLLNAANTAGEYVQLANSECHTSSTACAN
ncbi:MAG: tyrosine-type recombinase/integrase [Shimia sp.]|uniref:site-specific integrase n=1 Tax=Shimia sp. TaxID=1954381 RepID=UPI001B0B1992|nr:site-specific integrase [Shimia sp.]MBO6899562.1 tyrosine-type recombinase/integrase [Shimia sp.]